MSNLPLQFEIHPSSGVPIFRQIMDQVRAQVASGRLKPGELVPSVRQMAIDLAVNMMTVSKAYSRLEAEGILERDRGTGMRVRAVTTLSASVADRQLELRELVEHMVTRGLQLGLTDEQIAAVVKTVLKERRS
ncbi:MAG: GntR family transcriptional regulator [Planctomycetes bacterium]|nr:GntR family transcriptional regulator [Planctomycetota bacterium]